MAEGRQTQLFTDRLGHVRNGRRVGRARGHRFGAAALHRTAACQQHAELGHLSVFQHASILRCHAAGLAAHAHCAGVADT